MDSFSIVVFLFAIGIVQVDCQEGPKVAPFSSLVKPAIGGRISFLCHSLTGSPPFQIVWFKDGKDLQDTPEIRIGSVQDSSVLLVDSLKSSHSGNYTCKISNRYGSDSYTTELLVEGPPNWIKKPNNVKLKMHQMVSIQCLVSGYPKPMITWKKLQGSTWVRNDVKYNGDLQIMNATKSHGGRYGCSATNGIEPDLWSEFDISIDGSVYTFDKCSATWKLALFLLTKPYLCSI